ncbi:MULTISPECIES: alpha/beta hydrolase family protein [Eisenbergiella]|nr:MULTISPECIES: alpha/beta fold hydrolase [Eisenbergiella]
MNQISRCIMTVILLMCILSGCGSEIFKSGTETEKILKTQTEEIKDHYSYKMKEVWCTNGNKRIYGVLYLPERKGRVPLLIYSHGLSDTHAKGELYATSLAARGIAVYCFDFCGGSDESKSNGKVIDMSVMTEVSDLEAVLNSARKWNAIDKNKIVLAGFSQGGIVTAITAARCEENVAGIILESPAFLIPKEAHDLFETIADIPDEYYYHFLMVGKKYFEDIWDYDVYKEIGNYKKNVLLIHGEQDDSVDIIYSEYASEVYENVEFYRVKGAGHGVVNQMPEETMGYIFDYLHQIDIF